MGILVKGVWQKSDDISYYCPSNNYQKINYDNLDDVPELNRYILYTSLATPLAHASVLVRTIKKLEKVIGICIVSAEKGSKGWEFKKTAVGTRDRYNDCQYLYELYTKSDKNYSGGATVPLIWDNHQKKIVTNCPFEVLNFLNFYFTSLVDDEIDLYPQSDKDRLDKFRQFIIEELYTPIFKSVSVTNQDEYNKYANQVFQSLSELDSLLKTQQTLLGDKLTIVDWILFVILIRFDVVFASFFRLNEKSLSSFSYLTDYMTFLYQEEHIGCTANINHIKEHYYKSYLNLNPSKVIPRGPQVNFDYLYNRFRLF